MAIAALILILIFTVGWIAYLSVAQLRGNAGFITALLFCGGFGVLMFIGIKLYNPPGIDGDEPAPPQAGGEAEGKAGEQEHEPKETNE